MHILTRFCGIICVPHGTLLPKIGFEAVTDLYSKLVFNQKTKIIQILGTSHFIAAIC
jgi:hypothetical protein